MRTTGRQGRSRWVAAAACAVLAATFTGTSTGVGTAAEPRPTLVYLVALTPLEGSAETGSAEVNGLVYPRSIAQLVNASKTVNELEYHLGRHWKSFQATVGLRDDSPSGGTLSFVVSLDGTPAHQTELSVGQAGNIAVDVGGAFRMKLTVTYSGQDWRAYYGVWGDARLTAS